MKITKRQLRRIIREEKQKVLAENKVRRIVRRRLMEGVGMGVDALVASGVYITVETEAATQGSGFYIYISDENGNQLDGRVRGEIALRPPTAAEMGSGPCSGAFEAVQASAAKGWGPLIYDVAIEVATEAGGGLMSDRRSVPKFEADMWNYYYNSRSDVQSHQLDLTDEAIKAAKRKGIRLQKLNPDNPEDECRQNKALRGDSSRWDQSPFSKRYTKAPTTMNALRGAGRLIEK